ncbi:hypothetical protein [Actinomycetospora chibensis]|uniref:Uncharacterized protein n=1 Tax=Actinomycetospora chibensis TaxID=663606 RepID=A0ABV9RKW7_9PSEU|nr:hypothetical protein [Actinomycetospora chibensis]MDD7923892.1 hypothetical protein [Actinomycetospora chibensis]
MGQLSFWSADARPRALSDLEGLLCGPGRAELFGRGSLARLIVVLGAPPEPEEDDDHDEHEADAECKEPGPSASVGATLTSNVRIATSSRARHAEPDDGADEDDDPAPDVDLDDLAFLDLDPDELAARLGLPPADPAPVLEPSDRESGFPDVECKRGRTACIDAEPPDPTLTWRARAVCCALRARGVPAEIGRTGDGRPEVRTAFRADLVDLARAWTAGDGMKKVPAEFELDGPRLRLWVLAAGVHDGRAYTLGLDPEDRGTDGDLLTASRHLGLGASLRPPALRVVGARRQRRLGELVGRPPGDLIDGIWPV